MRIYHSIPTIGFLTSILEQEYCLKIERIYLHREMGGSIYYVSTRDQRELVLKIYKTFHTKEALQAADIMSFLAGNGFPVAPIVESRRGALHTIVPMPECECVVVVYEFIEGSHPDVIDNIDRIGAMTAELHEIMETYPRAICHNGRTTHVDDFIAL